MKEKIYGKYDVILIQVATIKERFQFILDLFLFPIRILLFGKAHFIRRKTMDKSYSRIVIR